MKTLKTGLLAAVISAPGIVCAQQANTITTEKINKTLLDSETVVDEVNKDGVRVPIHTNRFKDNWFIGMGIGSSTFYGNYCTSANMGERTSFAVDIHAGKWFTPVMGLRLNAFLYTPKGYDINSENPLVNGNAGNGLYKTKWTAGMATAEMMVNVSNLTGGYKKDRFYNFIPYVGAGWVANLTAGNRSGAVMAAGFLNRFNINDSWALNLDLRANIFPESLDLTAMGGKWDQDMITSLMVGFSYRFRKSGWETCNVSQLEIERVQQKISELMVSNRKLKDEINEVKPINESVTVKKDIKISDMGIFFEINQSNITEENKANIGLYADMIKKAPGKTFIITGHADKYTGNKSINDSLSKERAEAVYEILTGEFGVDSNQLKIDYKGGVDNMFYEAPYLSRVTIVKMEN